MTRLILLIALIAISTATILESITTKEVTLPGTAFANEGNWRIWGYFQLDTRAYYTAFPDGRSIVGWTDTSGNGHLSILSISSDITSTIDISGLQVRGIAMVPDSSFAALIWDDAGDRIYVRYYSSSLQAQWTTELTNANNAPTDFNIGESRLEFGDGIFRAYYHVHGTAGFQDGHEGETLKSVDLSGTEVTNWDWGCSHPMSQLLSYHPVENKHVTICVTDCFPGTDCSPCDFPNGAVGGIYIKPSQYGSVKIRDFSANCGGKVGAEIGSVVPADGGWVLVFNGHQSNAIIGTVNTQYPASFNQDIGFVKINPDDTVGSIVWLTSTAADEADSSVARIGESSNYLVGYTVDDTTWNLRIIDDSGATVSATEDVTASTSWNKRSDAFVSFPDGSVRWIYISGNSLKISTYLTAGGETTQIPQVTTTVAENDMTTTTGDDMITSAAGDDDDMTTSAGDDDDMITSAAGDDDDMITSAAGDDDDMITSAAGDDDDMTGEMTNDESEEEQDSEETGSGDDDDSSSPINAILAVFSLLSLV